MGTITDGGTMMGLWLGMLVGLLILVPPVLGVAAPFKYLFRGGR